MEKPLRKVIFEFEDGSRRILTGRELEAWEVICVIHSDYLLPGDADHVLAKGFGGLVRGFVPPSAVVKA